ncbi:MAG: hypothetical protein HWN67_09275 [Candidatus Helarchaeota archaeon]|nr:hypothetical protein [Candidatus Helarchaeota archaeon]
MVEKVAIGMDYFISGQNPYGKAYFLHAGLSGINSWWYIDFFYQYPPLSFIAYLPTKLYPNSMYPLDFRPSFYIMNLCIDMYIFYRMVKYGVRWPAVIFWFNPLFGMLLNFSNIVSLPLLFLTLGLINQDNPKKNALYLGLASLSYTYSLIVLAFFFFHYLDRDNIKQFFIGLLIPLSIFSVFLIWDPIAFISNLFFSQFGHPPYSFENTPYAIPILHVASFPPYFYTFIKPYSPTIYLGSVGLVPWINGYSGIFWGGLIITPYLYMGIFIITLYLIFSYFKYHRKDMFYTIGFPFIILGLLVLSTPGGYGHYSIIPLGVAVFGWQFRIKHESKES